MSEVMYPATGFGGFTITPSKAEVTYPPSGYIGFTLTPSKLEFIQQIRGFKGFSFAISPPSRRRTFHLVPRR